MILMLSFVSSFWVGIVNVALKKRFLMSNQLLLSSSFNVYNMGVLNHFAANT